MSVTVTSIQNPFQPEVNIKNIYEFVEGKSLSYYLQHIDFSFNKDISFIIGVNGCPVDIEDDVEIHNGDIIAVCAKVEGTVSAAVASWAVQTFTGGMMLGGVSGLIEAGLWGQLFVYGAAYVATSFVIGYGLSQLAGLLAPDMPSSVDTRGDTSVEQTYGWGDLQQTEKEGVRIPYLFGTNKVAGHIINQFITLENNNEILNILLGICDHEVDEITDIRLNDQPYTYYRDVEVETRLGTLNDDVISGFNDIITTLQVNSKLNQNSPVTIRTDGNAVEKLKIFITAPRGLYYSNNNGGLDSRTAIFRIEYKTVDSDTWILYGDKTITAATTEPQRYSYEIDGLSPNQYDVKVTRANSADPATNDTVNIFGLPGTIGDTPVIGTVSYSHRGCSDIYFSFLQEIVKQEQVYPGLAKYAIKALATDQLSGSLPTITCLAHKNTVQIYNENTGYWEDKRATNPAWIVYYLLVEYAGILTSKIIYSEFSEWADYCDEVIDSDYRFNVSTIVYTGNFWENIQRIAQFGRASVIRRGTRYGVFVDKPDDTVVDMFTMGNIISGTFKMHYLPKKDRANAIEIEYNDPDRDYTTQVITIYSEDYLNNNEGPKKTNLKIKASISQKEAIREGVYRLNSTSLLNRVITFDAFVDSFAATVGDIVYFQHILPDYSISIGGRILDAGNDDGSGNPYIKLDQEITIGAGEVYSVLIRLSDNTIVEKLISINPTTSDTFILQSNWETVPSKYDIYSLGLVDQYKKKYRLTTATRKDDFVRTLTLVEYIPEIYTNNDGYIIEEQEDTTIVQQADSVLVEEALIFDEFGNYISQLSISWGSIGTKGLDWVVWLEDLTAGTDPIKLVTTGNNFATVTNPYITKEHQYQIYINVVNEGAKNHFKNIALIHVQGKDLLPEDITYFYLQNGQLVWEYPGNTNEIAGYRLKSGIGTNINWTYADYVNDGDFVTSPYPIESTGKVMTYLLKAVDYEGRESENPATIILNIGDILVDNVVEESIIAPTFDGDITNGTVISDKLYSINNGDFWTGSEDNNIWTGSSGNIFFDSKYLEMTYIQEFIPIFENVDTIIEVDAEAPTGLLVHYKEAQIDTYWTGNENADFSIAWNATAGEYKLLPSKIKFTLQPYFLKITTNSGVGQSIINSITVKYDFPDVNETIEDVTISDTGTRLPITKTYQKIKNVSLTLQDDGGSAVTLNVVDKDSELGPFVYAEDKDRNKVTAVIDARIQGY